MGREIGADRQRLAALDVVGHVRGKLRAHARRECGLQARHRELLLLLRLAAWPFAARLGE
jgi:hypothetical protein